MCTERETEKELSFDLNIGDHLGYGIEKIAGVKTRKEKTAEDITAMVR